MQLWNTSTILIIKCSLKLESIKNSQPLLQFSSIAITIITVKEFYVTLKRSSIDLSLNSVLKHVQYFLHWLYYIPF